MDVKPYVREISIRADARFDEDEYPFTIPAVRYMDTIFPHADVTFFVGENGAGKSTILEAISVAMGLPSEGGSLNVHREQQDVSQLHQHLKIVKGFASRISPISCALKACSMCSPTSTTSVPRSHRCICARTAKPLWT